MRTWLAMRNGIWTPLVLKLLLIMFCVEFVKGALLVSVLPIYFSTAMRMSAYFLGWAFALQYVGDNAFRSPVGWAIDRWGYRVAMSSGLALGLVAVAMLAWLEGAAWMLAACFLLGAGTSPLWPCVVTGATASTGETNSGTVMSAIYTASFVGAGAGPIVINLFVRGDDMTIAFRLCVGLAFAAVLIGLWLPKRSGPGMEDRMTAKGETFWEAFRSVRASRLLYPAMFLQTLALGLLTPVVTLYAREDLGLQPKEFSLLLLAGGAATLLLLLPVGRWTDRFGTRPFLLVGIPLSAAATASFAFVSVRPQLYAAVIAVGLGYALLIPSWNALVAQTIPKQRRGSVWGAFLTIEGAGFVAGPIVSGWLWDHVSHQSPFLLSGATLAGLFVLHLFISFRKSDVLR